MPLCSNQVKDVKSSTCSNAFDLLRLSITEAKPTRKHHVEDVAMQASRVLQTQKQNEISKKPKSGNVHPYISKHHMALARRLLTVTPKGVHCIRVLTHSALISLTNT